MDFTDLIKSLADRIQKSQDKIQTEEATKNALIMPFIQALGYDIFDPHEVVPEFTADVGIKKGEKVDYAILMNDQPVILIECKHCNDKLENHNTQLFRYFSVTKARFAILTNGIVYKFFTDLDEPNKMDKRPFLEINMLDLRENLVFELKRFCKSTFNIDEITSIASDLKYSKEIKNIMLNELNSPSLNFVKHFTAQIYTGRMNQAVLDKFTEITKKSLNLLISDLINERLKSAIITEKTEIEPEIQDEKNKNEIITTLEELEGFATVKTILRNIIESNRIIYKDTQNYLGINLDNTKKPICRLYLNSKQKYIGIIDENKKESKHPIEKIDDIHNFTENLLETINRIQK